MSPTKLLQFLKKLCREGSEVILSKGYGWLQNTLSPTLKLASEQLTHEAALLAESWLIAGEVHELLEAPLQAVTCYKIALHFNPENPDIYHWLALVQEQLGQYVPALENIALAIKYQEEGILLMEERQRIQDCLVYDKTPDYEKGSLFWSYTELLAAGDFHQIIKEMTYSETKDIELLRCWYRALGAEKEIAKGEKVWQQILNIDPTQTLDELDRFYWM